MIQEARWQSSLVICRVPVAVWRRFVLDLLMAASPDGQGHQEGEEHVAPAGGAQQVAPASTPSGLAFKSGP